jgi:hypothetical protein
LRTNKEQICLWIKDRKSPVSSEFQAYCSRRQGTTVPGKHVKVALDGWSCTRKGEEMVAAFSSPDHGKGTVQQVALWSNLQNDDAVKSMWMTSRARAE